MKNRKWLSLYLLSAILTVIILVVHYGKDYSRSGHGTMMEYPTISTTAKDPTASEPIEEASPLGNAVVPIAAYFDERPQHSHKNSTVILVDVLKSLVSKISGCEVDGVEQSKFLARPIAVNWWIQQVHPLSHTELILSCFDMNSKWNSSVRVLFRLDGRVVRVPVKREGVLMPVKSVERDGVMVCTTGYGNPENLDEWLVYQQTIGVKLIHLNVDVSFVQNVNRSETLRRFLESGYVKLKVWTPYLNSNQVYYYSQSFKYQDCIYRYQNVYKYMMIIDFDEYFVPLGAEKDVHSYAKRLLSRRRGSVSLPSIRYYCKIKGQENATMPKDGNITKLYDTSYSTPDSPYAGKSIHIVKFVEEASVHIAAYLLPTHKRVTFSSSRQSKCFIFHVRRSNKCKR